MKNKLPNDLFKKRLKSHHDASNILDKYVKKEKVSEKDFIEKLQQQNNNKKAIYIHTPFCDRICSFCNLNRVKLADELDNYTDYIIEDLKKYAHTPYVNNAVFEAVYFGGGTPTVYGEKQLEQILKTIRANYRLSEEYEMTFETTLHNLKRKKLEVMTKYGVNRLSIGIQSFSDKGRKFYNRTFDKKQVLERLKDLKENFSGNICIDIIYNYPDQTIEEVREDARLIRALDISSSSFYSLMIHDGSHLSKNKITRNNLLYEKMLYNQFLDEILKEKDYYILELTKVAKKNKDKYKYIKVRNSGGDTLPIGTGAGGNIDDISIFKMNEEMSIYVKSTKEHMRYKRLGSLFQFPKINKKEINIYLKSAEKEEFLKRMDIYKKYDYVDENKDNYFLTREGVFWGNNISKDLLEALIQITYKQKL